MSDSALERALQIRLDSRTRNGSLRTLSTTTSRVDFSSNDYLGLARSETLKAALIDSFNQTRCGLGSTGSRLLTGNSSLTEHLESKLAEFFQAPSALLFQSGYAANTGLLSSILSRHDTAFYDEHIHASLRDGLRLSRCRHYSFAHNNLESLSQKLKRITTGPHGNLAIITEALFSMDGDFAPLEELSQLARKHSAALIVDEAHSTGLFAPQGQGKVVELGLESEVFARVHTFGKALGTHGAAVVGSTTLTQYLTNFARSFIYSTACPPSQVLAIHIAMSAVADLSKERDLLFALAQYFGTRSQELGLPCSTHLGPIQHIVIPGNDHVKRVSNILQESGFDCRAVLAPTVREGQERIRICLHAFNTQDQIDGLLDTLQQVLMRKS